MKLKQYGVNNVNYLVYKVVSNSSI